LDLSNYTDLKIYQDYINKADNTKVTDLVQWRDIFKELYDYKNYTYAYIENGVCLGIISVYLISSSFMGTMLITSPFFSYGGIYADNDQVLEALIDKIIFLGEELNVDFIEVRSSTVVGEKFHSYKGFSEFDLSLADDPDLVWQKKISSNVRQNIRKSFRTDLHFVIEKDPENCYKLLSRTIRDLGTPFHGSDFFRLTKAKFPDAVCFPMVYYNDVPVAGCVAVKYKDTISTPYIGSLKKYRNLGVNYFLYWKLIEQSIEWKLKIFEFGRSPIGSTHAQFKKKWGCKSVQLYYNFRMINKNKQYKSVNDPSLLMIIGSRVWRYLPLSVTMKLGRSFFKQVP